MYLTPGDKFNPLTSTYLVTSPIVKASIVKVPFVTEEGVFNIVGRKPLIDLTVKSVNGMNGNSTVEPYELNSTADILLLLTLNLVFA